MKIELKFTVLLTLCMLLTLLLPVLLPAGPGTPPGPAKPAKPAKPQFLQLSGQSSLKMVTIFPGEALYSMFGHTAIRVEDPVHQIDLLYNYGQSSVPFDASFVPRFVTGKLPFMLGVIRTARAYDFYRNYENRSIYEQDLLLDKGQRQAVFEYLEFNARPENRIYIYDFFHDNCTTRVRELFWEIFGKDIDFKLAERPAQSYRRAIEPYLSEKPFVQFGINLMLGSPTDGIPERGRRLYLPGQLMQAVAAAELEGRPLMSGERYVYEGRNGTTILPEDINPLQAHLTALVLWLLLAAALWLSVARGGRNAGLQSPALRILDAVLFFTAGVVGISSLLLWSYSGYIMTSANWHLLWAWPTHVIMGFLFIKKMPPSSSLFSFRRWYAVCAGAAALVSLVLIPVVAQTLPGTAVPLLLLLVLRGGLQSKPQVGLLNSSGRRQARGGRC